MRSKHLDSDTQKKLCAEIYLKELVNTSLVLPKVSDWADPVWHLFVIRHQMRNVLQSKTSVLWYWFPYSLSYSSSLAKSIFKFEFQIRFLPKNWKIFPKTVLSLPIPLLSVFQMRSITNAIIQCHGSMF